MTVNESGPQETRDRLLEAAGQVFAERGFHQATVREICERANANVAAVNYYFRGKEDLYVEVLKSWAEVAFAKYPPLLDVPAEAPAAERLEAFIRSFMFRLLDQGRPAWHGRVMAREISDPGPAFEIMLATFVEPTLRTLTVILDDLLGPAVDPGDKDRVLASIMGQILFYQHCRPVMERRIGQLSFSRQEIERLAAHICRFSLAGLRLTQAGPDVATGESTAGAAGRREGA